MNEIVLKAPSPKQAANLVSILLRNGFKVTEATIQFSLKENPSVKLSNVKDFPLVLKGTLDGYPMRVSVSQIEIGRHSDGSNALRKILKEIGFYFEERDLFTTKCFNLNTGRISLTFSKR